jgi:sugar fermentation stimulation protein A
MRGIYLLEISVAKDQWILVGALGSVHFPPGTYVYVGSAQRGLEARVARHFRSQKRNHWHVDYLLSARGVTLTRALWTEGEKCVECEAARALATTATAAPGFGSSDCACPGHLFRLPAGRALPSRLAGRAWRSLAAPAGGTCPHSEGARGGGDARRDDRGA